jgi:hypothetical protein
MVAAARARHPHTQAIDILDCADASGMAMGALRSQVCRLVLAPHAAGWKAVAAIAQSQGGFVLPQPPIALVLGQRNAIRRLPGWLRSTSGTAGDSNLGVG